MAIQASARDWLTVAAGGLFTQSPDEAWAQAQRDGWAADTPDAYCHRCGTSAGPGAVPASGCSFCRQDPVAWDRLVRLGEYRQPLRPWLTDMKFKRQWAWCELFGRELAQRLDAATAHVNRLATPDPTLFPTDERSCTVACAVPMHWLRRWRRGYNQAQLIAAALARQRGWSHANLLGRIRRTPPQTSVPPSQRTGNIRGSFAARPIDLTGWDIWLVDDIKTTGATLAACARLLRAAGARRVNVAVAAVAHP